mgnify:CR=1 FL=1
MGILNSVVHAGLVAAVLAFPPPPKLSLASDPSRVLAPQRFAERYTQPLGAEDYSIFTGSTGAWLHVYRCTSQHWCLAFGEAATSAGVIWRVENKWAPVLACVLAEDEVHCAPAQEPTP